MNATDTSLAGMGGTLNPGQKPLPPVSSVGQPVPGNPGLSTLGAPLMANSQAAPSLGYRPNMTPGAASTAPTATPTGAGASIPPISPAPAAAAPLPTSSAPTSMPYGQTAQFGPGHDLQSTQIAPGAESNRFDLAKQALDTYSQSQLPQFRAQVRNEVGNQAAMGRLGSGMLNTSLGNLDLAQQNNYNTMEQQLLNGALGNQITDNANQRQELRDERGYQTGQSNNAFNQGVTQTELGDQLTNSAFGRAATQEQMGEANNPANTQLILSSIFGGQANAANGALGGLIGNTVNRNAQTDSGMSSADLMHLIYGNTPTVPQQVPDYQIPQVTG